MDETDAVILAIAAAAILPLGTAISVYLDVKHFQELEKNKQQPAEEATGDDADADEEMGTTGTTVHVEEKEKEASPSFPAANNKVRFPTVSAATARFGSSSYNIFVVTTSLHAVWSQVFNYWWYDTFHSNEAFGNDDDVAVISTLATIGSSVAVVALWFMSLIPAKGRGTMPHIICGMIYFQAAIAWMVWICMVTNRTNNNVAFWIVQAILCSVSMLAAVWAFAHVHLTMKRYTPGTMEWRDSLHKGALGQFSFGIIYSIFIIVTAISGAATVA